MQYQEVYLKLRRSLFKRASMSLSINAIVVVVLAFVMLGLGLTLTRTIFTNIGDTQADVSEQVRQQVLDDLRSGNRALSFPTNDVRVDFRGRQDIAFGVMNTGSATARYCAVLTARLAENDNTAAGISFVFNDDVLPLQPTGTEVIPVAIISGSGSPQGLYRAEIQIHETISEAFDGQTCGTINFAEVEGDGSPSWKSYARRSFFITIR